VSALSASEWFTENTSCIIPENIGNGDEWQNSIHNAWCPLRVDTQKKKGLQSMQKWIESLGLVLVGGVDRSQTRSEMESLRLSVSQISKSEHSVFRKQMSSEKGTRNKLYIKNEDVLLGNKKNKNGHQTDICRPSICRECRGQKT